MTRAPSVDTDTSRAAADSIEHALGRLEQAVFDAIAAAGEHGATDDEIEVALSLAHQTASARRRTLALAGRIVDSGQRRLTRSGRRAIVWMVGATDGAASGAPAPRPPVRPSREEIGAAVEEIRGLTTTARQAGYEPSEALQRLGRWLGHLRRAG